MARKRSPLPVQVLLFLLVTLLGVATGNLNSSTSARPWGSELLRRQSLPLAGITVLLIIGVLVWQHRADELRTANGRPNAPVLVIVDQVEELISLSGADERDAFLSLVARALDADPRLRIIMIMRSEFLTAFLGHRAGSVVPQPGHGGDAGSRGAGRGDRATALRAG
jgi:hypothetical protein